MLFTPLVLLTFASPVGPGAHVIHRDSTRAHDTTMVTRPVLTVRPRAMATGTRTKKAGAQLLDSARHTWVYVPPQCVGTRQCPLVVVLGGADIPARDMVTFTDSLSYRAYLADRYGMILLAPEAREAPGIWDVIAGAMAGTTEGPMTPLGMRVTQFPERDVRNIDAAMQRVLREFAIDPEKIAVEGFSNGGSYALFLGRNNPQVFNRIAAVSPVYPTAVDDPPHTSTQIFISGGIGEGASILQTWLRMTHALRQAGHQVELTPGLRGHRDDPLDKAYEWQWLAQSWHLPTTPAARADARPGAPPGVPVVAADSDPILTTQILSQMTVFWTRFMQEPDSIRTIARLAHEAPVVFTIGGDSVSVVLTSMTALAAQYPSVAADLSAAGLTAVQEDRDRAAVIRVGLTHMVAASTGTIAPTSILGQNLAFREAQDHAFKALVTAGIWYLP